MTDTYDAGYLPDDEICNQDSIRVELAYAHDFYSSTIESQQERIAELEKERDIRDLEQQSKGAMKAVSLKLQKDETWSYASQHIETLADDLLSQSEALKEQGK